MRLFLRSVPWTAAAALLVGCGEGGKPPMIKEIPQAATTDPGTAGSVTPAATAAPDVSDTGRGIPAELHEQIFELEHSSRTHPGKMGFGLWWVKTLMTRLGGSVTVESDGSHGTTFHLRFPIAEQA